jgi:hypothetical protein
MKLFRELNPNTQKFERREIAPRVECHESYVINEILERGVECWTYTKEVHNSGGKVHDMGWGIVPMARYDIPICIWHSTNSLRVKSTVYTLDNKPLYESCRLLSGVPGKGDGYYGFRYLDGRETTEEMATQDISVWYTKAEAIEAVCQMINKSQRLVANWLVELARLGQKYREERLR